MVPVVLGGLVLAATIFGLPLGIALWVVVVVVCRDVAALLDGRRSESRRLALLCQAMALLGTASIATVVLVGYDDLFGSAANVVALGAAVAWVAVVVRGAQAASIVGAPSQA